MVTWPLVFAIQIKAEYPAAFVWLETPHPGRFSNNGFTMVKEKVTVSDTILMSCDFPKSQKGCF